jgi:hypothetical protein
VCDIYDLSDYEAGTFDCELSSDALSNICAG